jgi:hypothetical protein
MRSLAIHEVAPCSGHPAWERGRVGAGFGLKEEPPSPPPPSSPAYQRPGAQIGTTALSWRNALKKRFAELQEEHDSGLRESVREKVRERLEGVEE